MNANLYEAFRSDAPARPLIRDSKAPLTHGELDVLSARLANRLAARGLRPGDRIAVQVEKSVAALALYLAALRTGVVFLPLNSAYTQHELEFFIADAQPALVVCDPRAAAQLAALPGCEGRVETLDPGGKGSLVADLTAMRDRFATVARDQDDIAAILYTSGTTGRPKGAMISHGNLASNARTLRKAWRFDQDDVLLHALPIYHAHGLFVAANLVLLTGASMHFLSRFDVEAVIDRLPDSSVMMGVPTFYTRLLAHPRLGQAAQGMRLFISGSAPLLPETHKAWAAATGHEILERYGMTETLMLTSNLYEGPRVPGSVGAPLAGVALRITDPESGAPLPRGQIGMVEVSGPNVFKGYWQLPEKTAAEFRPDGYFITGDLGFQDERGYVHLVGRGKDLVITGGLNVYPREVEAQIDAIEGVVESAVIGLPHDDFGECVTAVVVAQDGASLDEAAILVRLDGQLSKFKMPKRVVFVEALPRNTLGKVQKVVLRDTYRALYQPAKSEVLQQGH